LGVVYLIAMRTRGLQFLYTQRLQPLRTGIVVRTCGMVGVKRIRRKMARLICFPVPGCETHVHLFVVLFVRVRAHTHTNILHAYTHTHQAPPTRTSTRAFPAASSTGRCKPLAQAAHKYFSAVFAIAVS